MVKGRLKDTIIKSLEYKTPLGSKVFKNVPIAILESVKDADFDIAKHDYYLSTETAFTMARQIAAAWTGIQVNKEQPLILTKEEIKAIFRLFDIKAKDFADLLGVTPGTISKAFNSDQGISMAATIVLFNLLIQELTSQGAVKIIVSKGSKLAGMMDLPTPQVDFSKLA